MAKKLLGISEVFLLATLIIVRAILPDESSNWISSINFGSLVLACFSTFMEMRIELLKIKQSNFVTGLFVIGFAVLVIVLALIFSGILKPGAKLNDIIMLFTLLVTLPVPFYKNLLDK